MSDITPPATKAQQIAGERRLRQLLFGLDLLAFLVIGAVAFCIWRFWPRGHDVYSDLQQGASETYLFIWMGIALVGGLFALSRRTRVISFVLSFLLLTECLAQLYVIATMHRPYHPSARAILDRFEPHPLFGAIPHQGVFGGLSHDAMHRRTTINEGKNTDAKPIYVFGGSMTYDVGVVDSRTWASDLSRLLGPGYTVENYGVPAYTSMESMIQSLFAFRDIRPVCAIYYEGSNDLRLAHTANLPNDYGSHGTEVKDILDASYRPSDLANYWLAFQLIDRFLQHRPEPPGARGRVSDEKDVKLSQIYAENMKLVADINHHFGVTPIFVPQVVNYDYMEAHWGGWLPMSATAVRPRMAEMNDVLKQAAQESGAIFLDAPLKASWQNGDFADEAHFSAPGAEQFAQSLAPVIAASCK